MGKVTTAPDGYQGESWDPPVGIREEISRASLGTTYEIVQPPPAEAHLARLERWHLQSVSRGFLPEHRVGTCLRRLQPLSSTVRVFKSHEKCHYGGLMVCGSIWVCPVCAAKISEHRRMDLQQGIETWKGLGGSVLLITHTVPHYGFQPLKFVLQGFGKGRRLQLNRKPFKGLTKRIGLAGTVRALEVTHGDNGWHVHDHELFLLRPGSTVNLLELQGELLAQWQDACESAGLDRPNLHGISVQDGNYAAKYASKWGMDCELTKSHLKRGREENFTPWDLLRFGKRDLFREYAKAFKGKRQLVWSKGLRDLLGLGKDKTDEEIAAQVDEEAELLGTLSAQEWAWVLRADRRGELLHVAEASGWSGVLRYIAKLIRVEEQGECPF